MTSRIDATSGQRRGAALVRLATRGLATLALAAGTFGRAQSTFQVVGWGNNNSGQLNLPALPNSVAQVSLFGSNVGLLYGDGTVTTSSPSLTLPPAPALPYGMTYLELDVGAAHGMARRSDGTLLIWGGPSYQLAVPALPAGVRFTQLDPGGSHSAGVRSDGLLSCWGSNLQGQCNVPSLPVSVS